MAHDWVKSPKKWIDPAKESTADKTALQSGQKTYQEICAERGRTGARPSTKPPRSWSMAEKKALRWEV